MSPEGKTIEQKVQACEKAEGLPFPFDVWAKLKNWCSAPDIQKAIADKKAWKQDWFKAWSDALANAKARNEAMNQI